jgi:hypothetical protein
MTEIELKYKAAAAFAKQCLKDANGLFGTSDYEAACSYARIAQKTAAALNKPAFAARMAREAAGK